MILHFIWKCKGPRITNLEEESWKTHRILSDHVRIGEKTNGEEISKSRNRSTRGGQPIFHKGAKCFHGKHSKNGAETIG